MDSLGFVSKIPKISMILLKSIIDYYRHGPPQPSWDLKSYLSFAILRYMVSEPIRIEEIQQLASISNKMINDNTIIEELLLPNLFRKKSETYIDEILKDYKHVLLDDWKNANIGNGLECEWVYDVKEKERKINHDKKKIYDKIILYLHGGAYFLCSSSFYRSITSKIAKFTNARLFGN